MSLTMRGRYLMREYFTDSDLFLKLDAREREIMVGLWMLADDDGWLPRDIPAIAAAIYRYEDRPFREGWIRNTLDRLASIAKLEKHRCCIRMPSVALYPRAGTKTFEHRDEHAKHSTSKVDKSKERQEKSSHDRGESTPSPVPSLPNPTYPDVARASAHEEVTEDRDSLDTYYDLTRFRPWGVWSGKALHGLEADYGVAAVIAAIQAEHAKGIDRDELLKAVAVRLAKDADRVRAEPAPRRVEPKPDRAAVNAEIRKLMGEPV